MPVRGCQKRRMVRKVTGRLIRLPASLAEEGVRISAVPLKVEQIQLYTGLVVRKLVAEVGKPF